MNSAMKILTTSCLLSVSLFAWAAGAEDNNPVSMAQFEQNVAAVESGTPNAGATHSVYAHEPSVQQLMNQTPNNDQKEAFQGMLQQAMPMTPSQIIDLKRRVAAAQLASAAPVGEPPKPVTSSRIVDLAPGAIPPVVRLEKGFISTLDFVDSSGNPWPIQAFDNGDPDSFNVSWDKKGNSFMIQARKAYTSGNIAVTLQGLSTPIMLTLIPGQKIVDYRVDLRIPGVAPGSGDSLSGSNVLPQNANQELLNVLNGIPPAHAQSVRVEGGDAQAWISQGQLFLRTQFAVLSPGWIGEMKSPDGTHAYVLPKTPTVLVSEYGTPVQFQIDGV